MKNQPVDPASKCSSDILHETANGSRKQACTGRHSHLTCTHANDVKGNLNPTRTFGDSRFPTQCCHKSSCSVCLPLHSQGRCHSETGKCLSHSSGGVLGLHSSYCRTPVRRTSAPWFVVAEGSAGEICRRGLAAARIDTWNFHPRSPIDTPTWIQFLSHSRPLVGQPRIKLPFVVGTDRQRRPICKSRRCPALHDVFSPLVSRVYNMQHPSFLTGTSFCIFLSQGILATSSPLVPSSCRCLLVTRTGRP